MMDSGHSLPSPSKSIRSHFRQRNGVLIGTSYMVIEHDALLRVKCIVTGNMIYNIFYAAKMLQAQTNRSKKSFFVISLFLLLVCDSTATQNFLNRVDLFVHATINIQAISNTHPRSHMFLVRILRFRQKHVLILDLLCFRCLFFFSHSLSFPQTLLSTRIWSYDLSINNSYSYLVYTINQFRPTEIKNIYIFSRIEIFCVFISLVCAVCWSSLVVHKISVVMRHQNKKIILELPTYALADSNHW